MKGRKLTLSIAAISWVAFLNVSSSGSSPAQHAAASTGILMKRTSADSETAGDIRPNGKIAFLRNRGGSVDVFVVNPSGMTPINLTRSRANELYVDWSPNARHVVFSRFGKGAGNLFRISRTGTGLRRLTAGSPSDEAPRWSPDGSAIAFDRTVEDGQADVFVVDAGGKTVTRLTANALGDHVGGWSPDGTKLAIYRGVLDIEQFDIWDVNADGSGEVQLTDDPGDEFSPVFSPDAARIAFMRRLGDQWDIFVMNADGTDVTRLTDDPLDDAFPQWSPQGDRILFSRGRLEGTPRLDVVVMNADGSQERLLIDHPADDFSPTWSPDGRWVTFVSDRSSNWELYVIGSEGERLNRITRTRAFEFDPSWGSRP
jgi:Tol biopolymer transport system component